MNRKHAITFNSEDSMTKQSFKDECNINKIMDKFQRTGVLNHYAAHAPTYGDASPIEYADALQTIATANEMFAELPSSVRKRFNNSPEQFLEFAQDPDNLEECRKMGLAPKLTQSPAPTPATGPTADPTPTPTPKDPPGLSPAAS